VSTACWCVTQSVDSSVGPTQQANPYHVVVFCVYAVCLLYNKMTLAKMALGDCP